MNGANEESGKIRAIKEKLEKQTEVNNIELNKFAVAG